MQGKVVLVTGGAKSVGAAICRKLHAAGANIALHYRSSAQDALTLQSELHAERPGSALHIQADLLDPQALSRLVEVTISHFGRLDALVNAVGGYTAGKPLWEMKAEALDQMLSLNLRSGYTLARVVAPVMLKQGRGAIVNVAATAAINHMAAAGAYVASKAAAVAMIDSLAADLKNTGVRANSILPSIIDTEANRAAMPDADFSKWPKPAEIADVVLFLCSAEAKLIQGAAISV